MRMKIIAGNLLAVLIVGLASYFLVQGELSDYVAEDSRSGIQMSQEMFSRSFRLRATEFVNDTRDRAATCAGPYSCTDVGDRRDRAYQAVQAVASWFQDPSHGLTAEEPTIVVLTDTRGRILARNLDLRHNSAGQSLAESLPALERVLQDGRSRFDVWHRERQEKFLGTAIAPVRAADQRIIGALVVGYDLSNGMLNEESSLLSSRLAILTSDSVYSSSLTSDQATALQQELFSEGSASRSRVQQALGDDAEASSAWTLSLVGQDFLAVAAPLPMTPAADVAYVVLRSPTQAMAAMSWTSLLLLFLAIGVLLVIGYGLYVSAVLGRPLEQIEEDVLAVINGNSDLRIDIQSTEFGGLAYRINQLINVFTGVGEEDSEGRISQAPAAPDDSGWTGAEFGESLAGATPPPANAASARAPVNDEEVASAVASEPEDEYWGRLYREYVEAKSAVGEDVSNITEERFVKRMKGNAKSLTAKHDCSDVRFRVRRDGDQVILQPVIIP